MTILPNTDLNGDSSTDLQDIYVMSASWMRHSGDPAYNHTADLNSDGVVDNLDADILAGNWRAVNAAGRHYYYHFDGLGSVIALTDSSGKTVEIYRYSAFGQTTIYNAQNHPIAASQIGNIYYFTARQLDTESGLYYYRARMYSPALGQFMQTDPVGYVDGMIWYAYCKNNPVIFVDPLGLISPWTPVAPGYEPTEVSMVHYAAGGAVVGAASTAAVIVAAPEIVTVLVTLGVSETVAVGAVTTGIFATGVAGGIMTGKDIIDNANAGNWNAVVFDVSAVAGSFAVGVSGGGRALSEGLMGKPSAAPNTWNLKALWKYEMANKYKPELGPPGLKWMATAPTPTSAGGATMFTSGGVASLSPIKKK